MTISPYAIATAGGKLFDFADPRPDMIDLETIAHHLAAEPRWCGNLKWPFSVAQHSVCVANAIDNPAWRIYGILHDAAEAYTRDIPTPLKQFMVIEGFDFYALERRILKAVWVRFGLQEPTKEISEAVDLADARQLATEARDVVKNLPPGWKAPAEPFAPPLEQKFSVMNFKLAFEIWMITAREAGLLREAA